jgi:MFS family permease
LTGGLGHALAARAGLTGLAVDRRLLVAVFVDTLGSGAFFPLTFLYLASTSDVPLSRLGLLITLASLAAIPAAPFAGYLVDRFGAQSVLVAQNAISAVGYALYFGVDALAVLACGISAVSLSERMYWAAWPVFVRERVSGGSLDRWFAIVNAAKNASLAGGAALAAAALALGGVQGLRAMLMLNIATSLVAAAVFRSIRSTRIDHGTEVSDQIVGAGTWAHLLRDRPYLALTLGNTLLSYAWLIPSLVLPIYVTRQAGLGAWTAAFALTLRTILAATLQAAVTERLERLHRTSTVLVGVGFFLSAVVTLASVSSPDSPTTAIALLGVGVLLLSLGEMAAGPATTSLGVVAAPGALRGRYVSVFQLSWSVSTISGPAVVGLLSDLSAAVMWVVFAGFLVLATVVFAVLGRRLPDSINSKAVPV